LLGPVNYFSSIIGDMLEEFLDAACLRRIMERDSGVEGDKALKYVNGKVELRNVSFSYPGRRARISTT
jgi:hypothetical protein